LRRADIDSIARAWRGHPNPKLSIRHRQGDIFLPGLYLVRANLWVAATLNMDINAESQPDA
jgi:hypothetical protein